MPTAKDYQMESLALGLARNYYYMDVAVEGPRAVCVELLNITHCPAYPYAAVQESKNCLKR